MCLEFSGFFSLSNFFINLLFVTNFLPLDIFVFYCCCLMTWIDINNSIYINKNNNN